MGSSSDEEFGWTNTSNDDSATEPEKTYDIEKHYKEKLKKEQFQNGDHSESHETPRERKKLKNLKREESSSLSPSPRRVKRESLANRHDDSAEAEHELKVKIKQEQARFAVPRGSARKRRASAAHTEPEPEPEPESESEQPRKKKKKRDKERDEQGSSATDAFDGPAADHGENPVDAASDEPAERSAKSFESPKKKKNRKETVKESSNDERYFDGWWKFEAEETVVQERPTPKKRVEEVKPYPSKQFVSDHDSSEDEPPAPAARPVQLRTGPSDANSVESPRRPRISDRITFEEESQSETGSKTLKEPQSTASPRRPRLSERITFEEDSQSAPEPPAPPQKITQRKSLPVERRRISDRITFEESNSEPERAAEPPAPVRVSEDSRRLGRFLHAHAHMHPVLGDFPPGAAITANDDIWIIRCPMDLPVSALKGITLDVDFKSKVKIGGQAYEATPAPSAEGEERVAVLAPAARGKGFCVRSVPVRGSLRLRAKLPRPHAPLQTEEGSPQRIPLPETRTRHPLLGADFEQTLPAEVRRRLAAASARPDRYTDEVDRDVRREKKKKKKKHKERAEAEPEPEPEVEPEPELKKHKRKHRSRHEPEPRESERDLDSPPRKKKVKKEKKEKKQRDDAAVWDSERAIEESLFNF